MPTPRSRTPLFGFLALSLATASCRVDLSRGLSPGELQGRAVLLGADGATLPADEVVVRLEGTPIVVKSDARGRFRMRNVPPGTYALDLRHTSGSALRLRRVELQQAADLGDLVLGRLGAIEAEVTRGGEPFAGTVVLVGVREEPIRDGNVRIDGLPPGEVALVAKEATGALYDLGTVTITAGGTTALDLELDGKSPLESFGFTGYARRSGATDHAGIQVEAIGGSEVPATTGADGLYLEAGVAAGVYTVRARAEGYASVTLPGVVVGGDFAVPDLVLLPESVGCESGGLAVSEDDRDADGTPDADEPVACRCSPGFEDGDEDGLCDHVDDDLDQDGVTNASDNCPRAANSAQDDVDADGTGDACDARCFEDEDDCRSLDSACNLGTCDAEAQGCVRIDRPEGTTCDDGDPCTLDDRCWFGDGESFCGGDSLDCSEFGDECHTGVCDGLTGTCEAEQRPEESACSDGDPCTTGDRCVQGECVVEAVDCSGFDSTCAVGTCDPGTGTCVATPRTGTVSCDDANACTTGDTCVEGACVGAGTFDCSAADGICTVGACRLDETQAAECVATPLPDGTTCSDTNPCTWGTSCTSGGCGPTGRCEVYDTLATDQGSVAGPFEGTGQPFDDRCPGTKVMYGVVAAVGSVTGDPVMGSVRVQCAELAITGDTTFTLTRADGEAVPPTGESGRGSYTNPSGVVIACPAGHAAVGFAAVRGGQPMGLARLRLECAPISVVNDPVTGPVLRVGTALVNSGTIGGTFSTPEWTGRCPAGTIASGQVGTETGPIETWGISCRKLDVRPQVTSPLIGGSLGGGEQFADCPPGQGPIGVEANVASGFYSGALTQLVVRCGYLVPGAPDGSGRRTVDVISGAARLPTTGAYGAWTFFSGGRLTASCPAGTLVAGVTSSRASATMGAAGSMTLHCATYTATETPIPADARAGPTTDVALPTGTPPEPRRLDCPEGLVPHGLLVNSGDIVDGVRLRCGPLLFSQAS